MAENRAADYCTFRAAYPEFIYEGFDYTVTAETVDIAYRFTVPGLAEFHPTWSIGRVRAAEFDREKLEALIFSLGMTELVSYWKIACPPRVTVRCGALDAAQKRWWKKLYRKGLGEFFYTNGIDAGEDFMEIACADALPAVQPVAQPHRRTGQPRVLIPIGGGKDSAVTLRAVQTRCAAVLLSHQPAQGRT
ncbi:MAG: hypothetical protein QM689_09305 [Oscillospiraceae bacterium]